MIVIAVMGMSLALLYLMLRYLTLITLTLTAIDHWTTYLCLRVPVEGWVVTEANPIANKLFSLVGLGPGLVIDSVITLSAILFLFATPLFSRNSKIGLLVLITLTTGYAVVNNIGAITLMGLAPWSESL